MKPAPGQDRSNRRQSRPTTSHRPSGSGFATSTGKLSVENAPRLVKLEEEYHPYRLEWVFRRATPVPAPGRRGDRVGGARALGHSDRLRVPLRRLQYRGTPGGNQAIAAGGRWQVNRFEVRRFGLARCHYVKNSGRGYGPPACVGIAGRRELPCFCVYFKQDKKG